MHIYGTYNEVPPELLDGQFTNLQFDENGNLKTTSGAGGASEVTVSNFPATQTVAGTVTVTGISTAGSTNTGSTNAAAYADDTGAATGTIIGLLKGIYVQNVAIIGLLNDIKTNTTA